MDDKTKTKKQLMDELAEARCRISELEASEAERKRAGEALWESEKRFRSIAETASDAIIIFDSHENIFFWNQAAQVIFGYRAGETRGRLLASIMPKGFSEVFRGEMDRMISTGESDLVGKTVEVTGVRKDGNEFPLELSLAPWKTREGFFFFTIIARDVGERKWAEEELRQYREHLEEMVQERTAELRGMNEQLEQEIAERKRAEEELKAQRDFALQVMNMMGQGLTVTDEERRFEYVNPAYARMIGCSPEDLIGKTPKDVTQAEDHAGLDQGYGLRLKGETSTYETRLRRVDGNAVAALITGAPYRREGQVVGSITVITDLTEHKRAEEELRQYHEQLEEMVEERTAQLKRANEQLEEEIAERKRAEGEIQRRAAQLATLHEAGAAVASRLTLEEIFDAVIKSLSEAFGYRLIGIYLIEEEVLELKAHVGYGSSLKPGITRVPLERGVLGRTARTCQAQLVTNVEEDPDFFSEVPGIASEVCVPLKSEDEVLGVLNVESDRVDRPLDASDLQLLALLSNHIVIAIENARLYEAAQRELAERKRAEMEIRKLNRFLDTVIDTADVWLDVIDERGNVVLRNRAAEEISGYSREEVVGHAEIWEWLYPDEEYRSEILAKAIARIETGEGAKDVETTIQRKDGQTRVISWNTRNLVDEEGNRIGYIALGHDITERKRAEEALAEERNLLRTVIDNLPDLIYVKDTESRYFVSNTAHVRFLGATTPDEVVGKTVFELYPQELAEQYCADDQKVIQSGQPLLKREERSVDQTDNNVWNLTTKVPLRDSYGKIVGIVGIARDITDRKRAEEELRQLKEFNESIVQGMEEGIVIEDAEGHITFVNPKTAEMLGYAEEELIGKHWSEIVAPSCLRQVEEESSKHAEGISSRHEAVLVRKDGKEVPILVSATPLFTQGEFAGTLGVLTDLTEMKEIEQQLIQAGKLAAIGQLVAGVAHELNNPLTSAVGYSQLLMGMECSEEMKCDLERINRQALRAAKIVENLLTFARRREPRKESININDVIERSLELQFHQLALDRISVVKELDEALPPTVADPFQMQQVFMNIIGNALQALRDWEGERRLRVGSEFARDMIHLEFADSGPGIPPEVMGRLFEPFFTTREVGEGTGLGLSISYGIVEAHGGRIWAESGVGKGTTFRIRLPISVG